MTYSNFKYPFNPNSQTVLSPINGFDNHKKVVTIRNMSVTLKNMSEMKLIDNNNISAKQLGKIKLHLNLSGSSMLARNFL